MKKVCIATFAMAALANVAHAQSSVTLYGIVDAAVRWSNNEGPSKGNVTRMIGGGMSQSRWGIRSTEDLGGGWSAIFNLENRFTLDDGVELNGVAWSQAWLGIQSSTYGRLLLGRQYNVIFDVMTQTYPGYRFSPYIEAMKPELGPQGQGGIAGLGGRNQNMAKYIVQIGGFTGSAQVSASEADPSLLKSYGAAAKYVTGPIGFGGGYLESESAAGDKAKAFQAGISLTTGPYYANYSYGTNRYEGALATPSPTNPAIGGGTFLFGTALTQVLATRGNIAKRELHTFGGTFNITSAWLIGTQYYIFEQKTTTGLSNGKFSAFSVLTDYALSKRTDLYAAVDRVNLKDGLVVNGTYATGATPAATAFNAVATGAKERMSFMVGLRHRF